MVSNLKEELVNRLKQVGAYDVHVADPRVKHVQDLLRELPPEIWNPLPVERFRRPLLEL